jgi:transposase
MGKENFSTQRLDHLGIVAGICCQIGLIQEIDVIVGPTGRKVTVGESVQAMVLNALGFVGRTLYLTPEFFSNKPVDILIGEDLKGEDLNDDSLGRALDILYEVGLTEIFARVACHALDIFEIGHRFHHLDSTTFSFHGEYASSKDSQAVVVNHGHSKDQRPDLKQVVVSLICTYRSSIPVWLEALDGNSSDKKTFPKIIQAYVDQMRESESAYFIADSALYSAKNLKELSEIFWLCRVPETVKEAKEFCQRIEPSQMQSSKDEGYCYLEIGSSYGGVSQRWLLVFSRAAYQREISTFEKRVAKEKQKAEKELWHLSNQEFESTEEAEQAMSSLQWRFHWCEFKLEEVYHYQRRGHPKGEPDRVAWKVKGKVVEDQEAILRALSSKGKFVLATNQLDKDSLPPQKMLEAYKGQGVSVERGFRFLKDPLFFASGLFLEKPERIMALLMIMGLALLVYALAEHKLRRELIEKEETVPNQVGKPTQRPTMRRVFQVFEGIDVLLIAEPLGPTRLVLNLKPIHYKILNLLGPEIRKCYFLNQ